MSLFWTYGSAGSLRILAAYDPYKRGLVMTAGKFAPETVVSRNAGLYVSPFIKSGAACQANANGSVYYVVLNGGLWIGRRRARKDWPQLVQTWACPSTVWVGPGQILEAEQDLHRHIAAMAAGEVTDARVHAVVGAAAEIRKHVGRMGFRALAQVAHPKGLGAIKSVTVDLLGVGVKTAMHDDGKHGDGRAGDGRFAAELTFTADIFDDRTEPWRYGFPGIGAATVTVTDKAGRSDSWSMVVSIQRRPEPIRWRLTLGWHCGGAGQEGPVSSYYEGLEPRTHAACFHATGPGPWRATALADKVNGGMNIAGRRDLSFYIKGDVNQELFVQLVDHFWTASRSASTCSTSRTTAGPYR